MSLTDCGSRYEHDKHPYTNEYDIVQICDGKPKQKPKDNG